MRMIRVPLLRPQLAEMNASLYIWNVGSVWSTLDHILRSPWNYGMGAISSLVLLLPVTTNSTSWTLQTYKPRGPFCVGDSIAMPSKIIVHDARIIVMPELRDCPHGPTHSVVTLWYKPHQHCHLQTLARINPPSNRAIPFRSYAARTFQARMRFEQGRLQRQRQKWMRSWDASFSNSYTYHGA